MTDMLPGRRAAAQVLQACQYGELRRLTVAENADEVEITGVVRSYYHKQMAQEVVRSVLFGRRLRNRLVVVREFPAVE